MTEQQNVTESGSSEAVINEALEVIDGALAKMLRRDLVSTGEVADLLLDVRSLLTDVNHGSPDSTSVDSVDISEIERVTSDLA